MKCNMGTLDRTIRIIAGLALIIAAAIGQIGWWGSAGIVPLATGLVGNCPMYSLLGICTCRTNRK